MSEFLKGAHKIFYLFLGSAGKAFFYILEYLQKLV